MVDDDSQTDTVPHRVNDEASAETEMAPPHTPTPLPPAPTAPVRHGAGTAQVGSRYALRDVLGQGGMGEVLLAFDEQVGREVAIKRIRADEPSQDDLARFVREAQVQGRLEHPAV